MLSGVTIFCFVASYTVALVLELTRLWFRSPIRGALLSGIAWAGWVAHTAYLGHNAWREIQSAAPPLSSTSEFYLLGAWLVIGGYLYLLHSVKRIPAGLFLLPVALLLCAVGSAASTSPYSSGEAGAIWSRVHAAFLLVGYLSVVAGFVVGVMYLLQARRLKAKRPASERFKLPALEWLERANHRATMAAAVCVVIGFIAGLLLNLIRQGEIPWSDPVVWRLAVMCAWLVAAALFAGYYIPAQHGRKVAYLTIAGFLFLAVSVAVSLLFPTEHKSSAVNPVGYLVPHEVPPCI